MKQEKHNHSATFISLNGDIMKKLPSIILTVCFIVMLIHASSMLKASTQALNLWFEKLVPSMFMSMVCIKLLYESNSLLWIPFPFCQKLFHISKQGMRLVLCSLLLGFPAGTCFLDEELTKTSISKQAKERLLYICMMPTSGFVIVTLGTLFFHSLSIGFLLYIIQICAVFTLLFITRQHSIQSISSYDQSSTSFMSILTKAIKDTGITLFMIGGYILCFRVLTQIFLPYTPFFVQYIGAIFLEFSSGCAYIHEFILSTMQKLYLTTALLSFGGFCIHMQIFSMIQHHQLSYLKFLYYRIGHIILSIFYLFLCSLLGFIS